MSDPTPMRVWAGAHFMAGGYGGWAFVRGHGETPGGAVGGERRTNLLRMELTGLVEALSTPDPARPPVVLHTASADVLAGLRALKGWRLAGWTDEAGAPVPEADLWVKLAERLATFGPASMARLPPRSTAKDATAFIHEWASVGADKVRAQPTFRAAIPKPNLARFPGLAL